ncbi:MAG: hypothetical protein HC866_15485 [Leptolyngbyaceae cyanobacterium RU_5_1]|nr:hypothetical protein [Leptolyngbyaceae cyanobacterium RU_5_1]
MNAICLRSLKLIPLTLLTFALTAPQRAFSTEPTQPSQRQSRAAVKPKPVVVINRKTAKKTTLLARDEVETIKTLQSAVTPSVASKVSPDGTMIVVQISDPTAKDPAFNLLNIQNGSLIEIDSEQFQGFKPDPYSYWRWRDAKTVVAIAEKQNGEDGQYALVSVNRTTGKVTVKPLKFLDALGSPVSLAPNTSRMLVELKPPEPRMTRTTRTTPVRTNPPNLEL